MKRLRDEVCMNPQFKRPFGSSSRGESYGSPHAPGGGGGGVDAGGSGGDGTGGSDVGGATGGTQKLTTNDALTYLKEVKDMFQDQREKYDRFLDVMKDFKAQRIDTTGVILRVKELFKGHPNLILGFNTFLPRGYEITLTEEEGAPKRTVEFDEAINFVNKIKNRFQDDDRVYKDFLAILNMYRKDHKGIADVYEEVSALFIDHPDLLQQFTRFLPDTSTTDSTALASFGRHPFHRFDERSSAVPTMRHSHVDKRLRRDKIIISRGERDPSVERPEVDEDKTVMTLHKDRKRRAERENKDKRIRYQDNRDTDNENNGDISAHRLSDKRKSAQKVDDFGRNANLVSHDDKDALKSMYSQEFAFCEKVKERLHSADDYQAFLKCLHIYSTEIITRKELQSLIADLLGKHPDLMEGFNEFFERCEQIEGFLAGVMGKKTLWNDGHSSKALRIEDKDKDKKREVDGGKEKDRLSSKYSGKSIQELDLSNCQRCTPSYRLLPEDYPIATASQRSVLGAQVLNDHWVSVTSGSEDYSFKHMRRNQYEESLFRCEDDRFELDMLLESVSSAAKRAEDLLNSITDNPAGSDNPIRVEEHFTALNLRCIERLYGDHGLDVMDILRKNPSLALPVILTRLKQKQEEWTKCRADFNKVWTEIYAKNHYKSLDHRSFYFKQQDSKNLSTKSLVVEIKEIKEKNENEDHVLLDIAAGSRYSILPNLEFEYADADIHEDLYEIIKYSSEEICSTKEQSNKVLRFYTTFLEPMLGVHSLRRSSDATEGDGFSKIGTAKNTVTSITESDGSPNANATTMNLKQPKPNCNGDSKASPRRVNSCKTSFTNMGNLAKEDGSTVASGGRLPKSGNAVIIEPDANHGRAANSSRANIDPGEDNHRSKLNMEVTLCSEGGETSRLNQLANGGCVERSRLAGYDEDYVDASRGDKEADKISSSGDFGENIATYQDGCSQSMAGRTRGHEEISTNGAAENDADADDDDDIEAGEDVSGSESAADEGSGEEHEEEEDVEMDGKAESEGDAEDASEGALIPLSERFLLTCKPLSKYVASPSQGCDGNDRQVFYGNDTFYVLFRLHQILYERILTAKVNSAPAESKLKTTTDAISDPYTRFKSALFGLLDGSSDNSKFEDDCRSLIGNQSYVLFTLDKLIYKLVKQLQTVSSDEVDYKLLQLYEYEKSRKSERYVDMVYYENVHVLLHDENIYRVECTSSPARLSIQLMDDGNEKSEVVPVSVDPDFADYFYNDYLSVTNGRKESSAVVLKRNMRKYANMDESSALCLAMENIQMNNGLECKTSATTSKISYVLDTEDSFIRLGRGRNESGVRSSNNDQARVQRFHQFLASVMP